MELTELYQEISRLLNASEDRIRNILERHMSGIELIIGAAKLDRDPLVTLSINRRNEERDHQLSELRRLAEELNARLVTIEIRQKMEDLRQSIAAAVQDPPAHPEPPTADPQDGPNPKDK